MSQPILRQDWHVNPQDKSARHVTGVIVQFISNSSSSRKPAALEIHGLEKLANTTWANRPNLLIEAGISLLKAL